MSESREEIDRLLRYEQTRRDEADREQLRDLEEIRRNEQRLEREAAARREVEAGERWDARWGDSYGFYFICEDSLDSRREVHLCGECGLIAHDKPQHNKWHEEQRNHG